MTRHVPPPWTTESGDEVLTVLYSGARLIMAAHLAAGDVLDIADADSGDREWARITSITRVSNAGVRPYAAIRIELRALDGAKTAARVRFGDDEMIAWLASAPYNPMGDIG